MYRLSSAAAVATALIAGLVLFGVPPAGAAVPLSGVVSQTPAAWTPNIFPGTSTSSVCQQWFGSLGCNAASVLSTAMVNGEVVVAGAFTQVCQPGPASSGHCASGTTVTRDDLFAYQLGTGVIDPNFVPQLDKGPVESVVTGPNNTVYVGGDFTTVNGVAHPGVVQLNVAPGNASMDGQVVTAFKGSVNKGVRAMAVNGNALYIGGDFTTADSTAEGGLARLNATTGAVDTTFSMPISNPPTTGLSVEAMSLAPSGNLLAVSGDFLDVAGQSRPRVALINTGGGVGSTAKLANWAAPIFANNCSKQHDYVRGIDISPDGSYLVVADTGYKSDGTTNPAVCDAAARFPTAATGTNIQPTWINYFGGDSAYSVQITGPVAYIGGHNRWMNNECGLNNICEDNAVLTQGLSAVDTNTGLAIPWFHPLTLRGNGIVSMEAFPAGLFSGSRGGLLIGDDQNDDAGLYRSFQALYPLQSTTASPAFGSIPSGIFSQGRLGGSDESTAGIAAMCVDDKHDSSTAGTKVVFSTCNNAAEQNWTVQVNGNIQVNGLCLDTVGQGTGSGTQVDVNTCGSSGTQVWTQGAGNTLVNQASGRCLDDPSSSTTNLTVLDIANCSGGANQVWPLPTAPLPASLIPDGPVSSSKVQTDTQPSCLNDTSTSPASAVDMWVCQGGSPENVSVESNGNLQINGLCVDTAGQGTANGTAVVLNTCGSSKTQVWTPNSKRQLVNHASGLCLGTASVQNGSKLDITTCGASGSLQVWRLPAV
jgi:hypothetical protein